MPAKPQKPRKKAAAPETSSGWITRSGRKPLQIGLTAEEHEAIRTAAFFAKKSMTQFVYDSALAAAAETIKKNS